MHHNESASFTTAFSSLPASSLPSLTSGPGSPLGPTSRKGSMSPPISRKGSHVALSSSSARPTLLRAAGGSGSLGTAKVQRNGKMASLPGDGRSALAAVLAAREEALREGEDDEEQEHEEGEEYGVITEADVEAAVQRTAASWSHPARGPGSTSGSSPKSASRKSSASAARLSMYMAMQPKKPHSGSAGAARASGRGSILHKSAPAAETPVPLSSAVEAR